MAGRRRFRETRLPITFAGRSRGVVILTRMKSVLQQMSSGVVPRAHRSNDAGLVCSSTTEMSLDVSR
jgi:hypothetical protein